MSTKAKRSRAKGQTIGAVRSRSVAERLWERVEVKPSGCWEYQGSRTYEGYGILVARVMAYHPRKKVNNIRTHRLSWELANAREVPQGMGVLHSCDNPPCVNPAHLRVGTNRENTIEAVERGLHASARQTHCANGHEFTPDNTGHKRIPRSGNTQRTCRACVRASHEREWAKGAA